MAEKEVKLEPELYAQVEQLVAKTGAFQNVDEYVNFVLAELFARPGTEVESDEKQALEERLKQLGYM